MDFNQADKVQEYSLNGVPQGILVVHGQDRTCIPLNTGNTDYQRYLAWVAEGNEPEAAE